MYNFILNMWKNRKIDETKVHSYCPMFINKKQVADILAAEQDEV